jgi:hypothetical protein
MEERKQQNNEQSLGRAGDDKYTHGGDQGLDNDLSQDGAKENVTFQQQTQKGKQQVDADLDKEQDRSIDKQDL